MGNACSCLAGLEQHDHHVVRYGDIPKYAPCERLQQVPVSLSAIEQKAVNLGHSSSPRKARDAPPLALEQTDLQQLDEQGTQQPQHWHSPNAADRQQHQHHLQPGGALSNAEAPSQQEQEELEVPEVPFDWTKGELIGIGAFGRVYTAHNNETGEIFAVKQVSFAKDEALQGRVSEHIRALEAEVDVLKTLKHDNIVRYLGTERTEDALHIFLEYVAEGSIASRLTKFGPFSENVIRNFTAQLLRGLEYLHARGIMHRDIKGANILIDKHGTVKLADFGASKKIEDLATVGSGAKSIRGTPYWMAPEVIKQTGHGRPADIWSLACTVIEMATGKPPWSTYTAPVAAMFQIASSKDPPQLPEHLSPEAKDFLLLCFNRVARDRANATRLLKHPFVTKVQLPSPQPFPGSSPGAAANTNSSPAGQRTGQGKISHHPGGTAAYNSTHQHAGRTAADQRPPLTPPGARHSSAMQPTLPGSAGMRQAAGAGALAANSKARGSPPSNMHSSPRRHREQQQQGGFEAAPAPSPGVSTGPLARQGDASAVVTAMRAPHQAAPKQQQQQQGRQSPRHYEQQQQQQPPAQQQHGQQQALRSMTPRTAANQEAAGDGHDTCMTLVDWNPMVEPSWLPGTYQPHAAPGPAVQRREKSSGSGVQQQQHHQATATGHGNRERSLPSSLQPSPAPDTSDMLGPRAAGQPALHSSAAISAAGGHVKRGSAAPANNSSSILSVGIGGSTRSNGGIGSRKLEGSGPLASGPVGRASRENGLGIGLGSGGGGGGGGAAAAAAGGTAGRLGSRAWGTGAPVPTPGPSSGMVAVGTPAGVSSPTHSLSTASGSAGDVDAGDDSTGPIRTQSSSTSNGTGTTGHPAEPHRLSSSGSYGHIPLQHGVAESLAAGLSSKHAQWEQELLEELAKQREEHRASRAASRRSALQQL